MIDFLEIAHGVRLAKGAHASAGPEMCAMEMVAWLEGEPHSDRPQCACPVVGAFVIRMNDVLPDLRRSRLLAYLPRIAGTRATPAIELRRARYLAWRAVTVFAARTMAAAGLHDHANALRACPDVLVEMKARATAAYVAAKAANADYAANAAAAAANAADYAVDYAAANAADYAVDYAATIATIAAAAAAAAAAAYATIAAAANDAATDAVFATLDGVLAIGDSGGFTKALPAPGKAARMLGMVV